MQSEVKGLESKAGVLRAALSNSQSQLQSLSLQQPQLADLQRNVDLASAVYANTLTKQALSRTDRFSTYPLVQTISAASLPTDPSSPKKLLALAGGLGASFISATALGLLWLRSKHSRG